MVVKQPLSYPNKCVEIITSGKKTINGHFSVFKYNLYIFVCVQCFCGPALSHVYSYLKSRYNEPCYKEVTLEVI